jgi:iron complex outermembrane receptor protein
MGYVKNVFNTTAITGDFLNSDDSGLTTNIFLTDPRLFGVRVTKDFGAPEGGYGVPEFFSGLFSDADGKKPSVWLELGGDALQEIGTGAPFTPAFVAANPNSAVLKPVSPIGAQRHLPFIFEESARVSFQPEDSDWVFAVAARIGRSQNFTHIEQQTSGVHPAKYVSGVPAGKLLTTARFADTQVHNRESHAILDFSAGKDVGLGLLGPGSSSVLELGVRFAQFESKETFDVRARPAIQTNFATFGSLKFTELAFSNYHATGEAARSFHGAGPSLSWTGSAPVTGDPQSGQATFDWGVNAAMLFGRQKTHAKHMESAVSHPAQLAFATAAPYDQLYQQSHSRDALRFVAVPNLGGFAGLSMRYRNAKVSFGYRGDFFFNAIDGGIDKRHSETLGFFGPFANISIGFGG